MMSLLLLGLLGSLSAPADTARYTLSISYQETALQGRDSVTAHADLTGWITLMSRDSAGARRISVRLDSLTVAPGSTHPMASAGDPRTARGTLYTATLQSDTLHSPFQTTSTHRQASLITQSLDNLYPTFRRQQAGAQWVDSSAVNTSGPVAQNRTTIARWSITSIAGGVVVASATTHGEGTITQSTAMGQRIDEMTMTGERRVEGPLHGPMHRASAASVQHRVTHLPGTEAPIPATIRTATTFTRIP